MCVDVTPFAGGLSFEPNRPSRGFLEFIATSVQREGQRHRPHATLDWYLCPDYVPWTCPPGHEEKKRSRCAEREKKANPWALKLQITYVYITSVLHI